MNLPPTAVLRWASPRIRCWLTGLCVFVCAMVVRLFWVPTWPRLSFPGHEGLALAAFQGMPARASTQAYPGMTALWSSLGMVTDDPRALTWVSAVAGSFASFLANPGSEAAPSAAVEPFKNSRRFSSIFILV